MLPDPPFNFTNPLPEFCARSLVVSLSMPVYNPTVVNVDNFSLSR